jgi:hypothetical protein
MTEESKTPGRESSDLFDIGSLFRSSATITFVVQIVSVIVMLGCLAAYYVAGFLPGLSTDLQVLLLLVGSIITLIVFLAALSLFVRFSRRISDAVIGPGIERVRMDTPRVKAVVYMYAVLVTLMGITGAYVWYLVYKNILWPMIGTSMSLQIFSYALGAFFIALLIQIIVAGVGRSATKVITEVLAADDSEFTG